MIPQPNRLSNRRQALVKYLPGQLVIQVTDRCNARCPQCGMRVTSPFRRSTLPADEVFRIIDAAGKSRTKAISFTGGEPLLLLDDLCAFMNRAGRNRIPFIRTGTNGYLFQGSRRPGFNARMARLARKLCGTPMRNFWISIDSSDPVIHDTMRGFEGLMGGINSFFIDAATGDAFPCGFRGKETFGKFHRLTRSDIVFLKECRRCDWECFRDPSELLAPLIDLAASPLLLARSVSRHPEHYRMWMNDLLYFRACGWFDGRKEPYYRLMGKNSYRWLRSRRRVARPGMVSKQILEPVTSKHPCIP